MCCEPPRPGGADDLSARLGVNEFETSVYRLLAKLSPISVDRAADVLGAAAWRVNGALDLLASRGAAWVDRTRQPWSCGAIPLIERGPGGALVAEVSGAPALGQVRYYRLGSTTAMLACARDMLRRTRQVALLDLFPHNAAELKDDLVSAASRHVEVMALVYEPLSLPGVRTVQMRRTGPLREWPGQQLTVVSDAEELLTGMTGGASDPGQGVWTDDPLITVVQYDGMLSQIVSWAIDDVLMTGGTIEQWAVQRSSFGHIGTMRTPGYAKLRAGWAEEG